MIIIFSLAFIIFYIVFLKNTIFGFSFRKRTFGGFLLARELFIYVLLGVILFNLFGLDATNMYFYITESSIKVAEAWILYALFMFVFVLGMLSKTVFRNYLKIPREYVLVIEPVTQHRIKLVEILLIVLFLLQFLFIIAGMNHAFLSSLMFGGDLMHYRLSNSYSTSVPTVIMSYYDFTVKFYAIALGIAYSIMKKIRANFYLLFLLFSSSFMGAKDPIISNLILFFLAYTSVNHFKIIKSLIIFSFSSSVLAFLLYFVVKTQFPHLDFYGFFNFLFLRLGTGQIQGVYEQFSLQIKGLEYIWHTIPFANFFMDYPRFNKDLMMSTFGQNLLKNETGVMNSFYIGEAFAIGGWWLVLFSPVIVAVNYALIYFFSFKFFKKYFGFSLYESRFYLQLLIPSFAVMTGDIAGYLFGKLLVMILIFLGITYFCKVIYENFLPMKNCRLRNAVN